MKENNIKKIVGKSGMIIVINKKKLVCADYKFSSNAEAKLNLPIIIFYIAGYHNLYSPPLSFLSYIESQ